MIGALLRRFGKPPVYVVRPYASPAAYLAARAAANFSVSPAGQAPTRPSGPCPAAADLGGGASSPKRAQ